MHSSRLLVFVFILLTIASGGIASGQCDPNDGNNTQADAQPVGYVETVSDWVCPDDCFDFYFLDIPQGAGVTGSISFSSPQRSTVLRIWHGDSGTRIVNDIFTNDTVHDFTIPVSLLHAPGGIYYARVFYWSEAAFDHEYTLSLDLDVSGVTECEPDGNDDTASAGEIAFGSSVSDWICADDPVDIWHFVINAPETEGLGTITLTVDPAEVIFQFHDVNGILVSQYPVLSSPYEVPLGMEDIPYPAGDYYIGIALPEGQDVEHSYTLSLTAWRPPYLLELLGPSLIEAQAYVFKLAPWPSLRADTRNTSRSDFGGPGSEAIEAATHDLLEELDLEDDPTFHAFEDLILGPDNMAYFKDRGTNTLYAYDLMAGYRWHYPIVNTESPFLNKDSPSFCLDSHGNVYAIAKNGVYLHKLDPDGNEIWNKRIYGADGQSMALWPVGKLICITETTNGMVYLYIWQPDGTEVLTREELYRSRIPGLVQSKNADIYVRTISSTYKFNLNGINQWADHYIWPSSEGLIAMGDDGRVWVYLEFGRRYKIYNPDGTLYRDEHYPWPGSPVDACVGRDGRFYWSTDEGQLVCCTNWDQEVWRIDNPGDGQIMRIIMDKHGFIYMLYYEQNGSDYSYSWATVDPDDGEILFDQFIVQPSFEGCDDPRGHIAIGENGYLVYLNECGWLSVYKPVFSMGKYELKYKLDYEGLTGG